MPTNGRVTIREVHSLIRDIRKDIKEMDKNHQECLKEVSTRITIIEVWRANITGKIAIVGGIFLIVMNVVIDIIKDGLKKGG